MKAAELEDDIRGELDQLQTVVDELISLSLDTAGRDPSLREKVAAAGFLAQFYTGIENILKRISRFHNVPLPQGEGWHVELFTRFAQQHQTTETALPLLFDEELESELARYRGFRHVARMAYGVELRWDLMREGVDRVDEVFLTFKTTLRDYLEGLDEKGA